MKFSVVPKSNATESRVRLIAAFLATIIALAIALKGVRWNFEATQDAEVLFKISNWSAIATMWAIVTLMVGTRLQRILATPLLLYAGTLLYCAMRDLRALATESPTGLVVLPLIPFRRIVPFFRDL